MSIDNYAIYSEHKTFKNYGDVNRILDRKDYFEKFDGEKLITKQPLS